MKIIKTTLVAGLISIFVSVSSFAEKVKRPKAGQLAKLNTMYNYHENTQKCFKSGKKS